MAKKRNRKAFTIVELVIVIAVIAILATVLVPTFGDVIEKAQDSKAMQAAKNAYTTYIIENNGVAAEYMIYESDSKFVALKSGAALGAYESKEEAMTALLDEEMSMYYAFVTEVEDLFVVRECIEKQLVMDHYKVETPSSKSKCEPTVMPFTYSNLSIFENCDITKIQLYVENVSDADKEYTFDIQLLDAASVKKDGIYTIKKTYTLRVMGNDLEANAWNTFDVSHLGIYVGEGETLGFGSKTSSLPTYYCNAKESPALSYFGYTSGKLAERTQWNLLVGVMGVETPTTLDPRIEQLRQLLQGKNLSVFGASMCTYNGYSNDTKSNTTIGSNAQYYPQNNVDSVDKTFWMQLINEFDMELLVNNSWSGSKILDSNLNAAGYNTRPTQLHANTGVNKDTAPDVIVSFMGNNDYTAGTTVGTADEALFAWVDQYIAEGSTKKPNTYAEGYAIMVAKMAKTYPDAKIFLFNMVTNGTQTLEKAEKYNAVINAIAEHYGCYVVDLTHSIMSGANYKQYTVGDDLHPNTAGMDIWTDLVIDSMIECYLS